MKKYSYLWLLPLAAALFFTIPSDLSALTDKEQKQLTSLEAKSKLSKSQQKQLDKLRAKAAAEQPQIVEQPQLAEPAPTLTTEPVLAQIPVEPITPPPDNTTLDERGALAVGSSESIVDNQKEPEQGKNNDAAPQENPSKNLPKWIEDPRQLETEIEEYRKGAVFIGIGSATHTSDSQAIQIAEARARQDLAFQQRALVKAEITDYSKNVTTNRGNSDVHAAEDQVVAQQSIDVELYPVKVEKREKIGDTWWVVVSSSKIPEPLMTPGEVGYTESAADAVKLMNDRLAKNRLKAAVVSPAVDGEAAGE